MTRDTPAAVAVAGLTKYYETAEGWFPALQDVSLSVAQGEFVCLLGPSGCGKSTLLNVMAGLEAPDSGDLQVQGRPLAGRAPIAYMQQKDLLLPWRTLWGNILLGPELESSAARRAAEDAARELVRHFQLEGFMEAYPAQLSGGMRQRAALIRTLLCEQPILLLDEPFTALDAMTRRRLQRHVLEVWERYGKTIVQVTHDVHEAVLLADRIVLMTGQPGRIQQEYTVPVPRAERETGPEAAQLRTRILEAVHGAA